MTSRTQITASGRFFLFLMHPVEPHHLQPHQQGTIQLSPSGGHLANKALHKHGILQWALKRANPFSSSPYPAIPPSLLLVDWLSSLSPIPPF